MNTLIITTAAVFVAVHHIHTTHAAGGTSTLNILYATTITTAACLVLAGLAVAGFTALVLT